jgi:hypothetical protein
MIRTLLGVAAARCTKIFMKCSAHRASEGRGRPWDLKLGRAGLSTSNSWPNIFLRHADAEPSLVYDSPLP